MNYEILNAKVIGVDDFRNMLATKFKRDDNGDRLGLEFGDGFMWIGYPHNEADLDYVTSKLSEILDINEIIDISVSINDKVIITYR